MSLKVEEAQLRKKAVTQKSQKRRAQGILFLEAAVMLPMAAAITFGVAYYANAYVTKTRLADSARVIARAIQDDPTISQGNGGGSLGDLDRVILVATGNGDPVPEGFNVATYKSCNADLSSMSDAQAQEHFARAGRYERREGAFGNCNERRDVGARDTVVNIQSYAEQPTDSQIKAQFPYRFVPNPERGVAAPQADGWHPSGRNTNVPGFGWSYANPNTDKTKPYWISVVAKKPVGRLSLFGWTFGSFPEIVNHAVVRVVPKNNDAVPPGVQCGLLTLSWRKNSGGTHFGFSISNHQHLSYNSCSGQPLVPPESLNNPSANAILGNQIAYKILTAAAANRQSLEVAEAGLITCPNTYQLQMVNYDWTTMDGSGDVVTFVSFSCLKKDGV